MMPFLPIVAATMPTSSDDESSTSADSTDIDSNDDSSDDDDDDDDDINDVPMPTALNRTICRTRRVNKHKTTETCSWWIYFLSPESRTV